MSVSRISNTLVIESQEDAGTTAGCGEDTGTRGSACTSPTVCMLDIRSAKGSMIRWQWLVGRAEIRGNLAEAWGGAGACAQVLSVGAIKSNQLDLDLGKQMRCVTSSKVAQ